MVTKEDSTNKLSTIIDELVLAYNLPKGCYKIDVFSEETIYNYIDTETGVVSCSFLVKLSCGCCHDYEQGETLFKDIGKLMQCEILIELYQNYC